MGNPYVAAIPRTLHRGTSGGAAIALPAAGTKTTLADQTTPSVNDYLNGAYQVPAGIYRMTFWCTYTRGAANGAVAVGAMRSNGTETARAPVVDSTISTTADTGYGQQNVYSSELAPQLPPGSSSPVTYPPIDVDVNPGETVWLQAAEVGVPATPGTLLVAFTASPGAAS